MIPPPRVGAIDSRGSVSVAVLVTIRVTPYPNSAAPPPINTTDSTVTLTVHAMEVFHIHAGTRSTASQLHRPSVSHGDNARAAAAQ